MQTIITLILAITTFCLGCAQDKTADLTQSIIGEDVIFEETGGVVAVEAEHFFKQEKIDVRAWYLTTEGKTPVFEFDADEPHLQDASNGAYLEILPDTRQTPADTLLFEENFTEQPGTMAVLHYKVYFNTPGRYYVWARIYSTGPDDNGLHVGLDSQWPDSGKRMQWIAKRQWKWGSKQRTKEVHTGVKHLIFLDIEEPGQHVISFSMREDGTEFDKWMMTTERLETVEGFGPAEKMRGK